MGSDAELFVFDYDQYREEVVAALVELLHTGEVVPWLGDVFKSAKPTDEHGFNVTWPRLAAGTAEGCPRNIQFRQRGLNEVFGEEGITRGLQPCGME